MSDPTPPLDPDEEEEIDEPAARRSVLKVDVTTGVAGVAVGIYEGQGALLSAVPAAIVAGFAVATGLALYAIEHDAVPGIYPEVLALASLVALASLGAVLITVLPQGIALIASAALAGAGLGLLVYRTVFGLVYAVPRMRLERAS